MKNIFRCIHDLFVQPKPEPPLEKFSFARFPSMQFQFLNSIVDLSDLGIYQYQYKFRGHGNINFQIKLYTLLQLRNTYIKNPEVFIFIRKSECKEFIEKNSNYVTASELTFFSRFVYVKYEKLASYLVLNGEKMLPMENFKKEFSELFDKK